MHSTEHYDLTTVAGIERAIADFAKQNPVKANVLKVYFGPHLLAAKLISQVASNLFKDSEKVIEAQRKAAVEIIRAGKEQGAKKMTVTLNQKAGLNIGSELDGFPLKFSFGSDSKMIIEVEYANA